LRPLSGFGGIKSNKAPHGAAGLDRIAVNDPHSSGTDGIGERGGCEREGGRICYTVEVHEHRLAEALITAPGWLTPEQALSRVMVEKSIKRIIEEFCVRWLKPDSD
jgi:hypothetical protein